MSPVGTQHARTFETTLRLSYLLHLPAGYGQDSARRWPLILFLHGMGERGDDLELLTVYGIPKIVAQQPDFPFITVSPQCPDGQLWHHQNLLLKRLLDSLQATYAVDADRVYLTGLSMGGFGTWSLALSYPNEFAAIAPVCGGGFPEYVSTIKHVPAWVFHGDEDDVVPLSESQKMVEALRRAGGEVRFTVYPGVGHDSWTQTYENPALYGWFLENQRSADGTEPK